MIGRVRTFAVGAELIPGCRRIATRPWPLITDIGPDTRRRTFALGLHLERRIVGEDRLPSADMAADRIGLHHAQFFISGQRSQQFVYPGFKLFVGDF